MNRSCIRLLGLGWLLIHLTASAANYSTGFESAEGYVAGVGLDAQPGAAPADRQWYALAYGPGGALDYVFANDIGNGVVSGGLGGSGQAAYVGFTPLPAGHSNYLDLYIANTNGPLPVVKFSVKLKFVDSTNGFRDAFRWDIFNGNGDLLFAIRFNNATHSIEHLNSTNLATATGFSFSNGVEYTLAINMNFTSNQYSATFNGATMVNAKPISVGGAGLDFWSADAIWKPASPATPGDNYMLFDDYTLSFEAAPAQILLLSGGPNSAASLRVTSSDGAKFALDSSTNLLSWSAIQTNTIAGGLANYTDAGSVGKPVRYYRARLVP